MSAAAKIVSTSYLILHSEYGGDFGRPWLVIRCFRDSDRQDVLFNGGRKDAEAYITAHWDDDLPTLPASAADDFDGSAEPMRAIRDLISACEAVFGADCGEDAILRRARDGFTTLRKLAGDERIGEEIAEAAMIEPKDLREPLQLTAAALQIVAREIVRGEERIINFTGRWMAFAPRNIAAILDRANEALDIPGRRIESQPFHGATCPDYPNCSGGCGCGCTFEIEQRRKGQRP
jgi:hypothetical protein